MLKINRSDNRTVLVDVVIRESDPVGGRIALYGGINADCLRDSRWQLSGDAFAETRLRSEIRWHKRNNARDPADR